jgi:hypothetical protein
MKFSKMAKIACPALALVEDKEPKAPKAGKPAKVQEIASFSAHGMGIDKIVLTADTITRKGDTQPLEGVEAVFSGGTMLGHRDLTITGPDFAWVVQPENVKFGKAAKFAAAVNLAVRQAAAS